MKNKILILTPVYKDWNNLDKLLRKINKIFAKEIKSNFEIIIIDDFSNKKIKMNRFKLSKINKIRLITLSKILEKSVALGLKYVRNFYKKNYHVLIMNSDGQDNSSGILEMYKKISKKLIKEAGRGQRKEVLWFRVFYEIYYNAVKILSLKK